MATLPHGVYILNNGPKKSGVGGRFTEGRVHAGIEADIKRRFSGVEFTDNPRRAEYVILPEGVREPGQKLLKANALLNDPHRWFSYDQIVSFLVVQKASQAYRAVEQSGGRRKKKQDAYQGKPIPVALETQELEGDQYLQRTEEDAARYLDGARWDRPTPSQPVSDPGWAAVEQVWEQVYEGTGRRVGGADEILRRWTVFSGDRDTLRKLWNTECTGERGDAIGFYCRKLIELHFLREALTSYYRFLGGQQAPSIVPLALVPGTPETQWQDALKFLNDNPNAFWQSDNKEAQKNQLQELIRETYTTMQLLNSFYNEYANRFLQDLYSAKGTLGCTKATCVCTASDQNNGIWSRLVNSYDGEPAVHLLNSLYCMVFDPRTLMEERNKAVSPQVQPDEKVTLPGLIDVQTFLMASTDCAMPVASVPKDWRDQVVSVGARLIKGINSLATAYPDIEKRSLGAMMKGFTVEFRKQLGIFIFERGDGKKRIAACQFLQPVIKDEKMRLQAAVIASIFLLMYSLPQSPMGVLPSLSSPSFQWSPQEWYNLVE